MSSYKILNIVETDIKILQLLLREVCSVSFIKMLYIFQQELEETKKKMQETQEELSAWKFTPDSATGKRLMAKCRQLLQENEDIGKMISSGRLAKLENELAMQKVRL